MKKYDNYMSNLDVLKKASTQDMTNDFIVSGIIDIFYLQFELGWKLLKELMRYEGRVEAASGSPRAIIKSAYKVYNFMDEEMWINMLDDRNDNTHHYNKTGAIQLVGRIIDTYTAEFIKLGDKVKELYGDNLSQI